jgi:hypothetical protein
MVVFSMLDVRDGIIERNEKIVNEVGSFFSFFNEKLILSVKDSTDNDGGKGADDPKEVKVYTAKSDSEDSHVILISLWFWWLGAIIATIMIFRGRKLFL